MGAVIDSTTENSPRLSGWRVAVVGRLTSMGRRELAQLLRDQGALLVETLDQSVSTIVVGDDELPLVHGSFDTLLDASLRQAIDDGRIAVLSETHLWEQLGLVEYGRDVRRLYTPAMLADLLKVPIAVVRRWHRRGLIVPVREVRRLPYFDFQEVSTARRLAELLLAGVSAPAIEKKLAALARYLPEVERPLAQLSVIVRGKDLLLRQGAGLVEPGGQLHFDFEVAEVENQQESTTISLPAEAPEEIVDEIPRSPRDMLEIAVRLEDEGELEGAADLYRAALSAGGADAEIVFRLAEVLYQLGDLGGARERYYQSIELDEDFVEARANLGCVLLETGRPELAAAAFEGALKFHSDYADVHYHLAKTLDELGRQPQAEGHWRTFLSLAPDSPWGNEARRRLGLVEDDQGP